MQIAPAFCHARAGRGRRRALTLVKDMVTTMRTRHRLILTFPLILLPLIARAFNTVVAGDLAASSHATAEAIALPDVLPAQNEEVHPTPAHTGWAALGHDLWGDFKAFPRRPSTWV